MIKDVHFIFNQKMMITYVKDMFFRQFLDDWNGIDTKRVQENWKVRSLGQSIIKFLYMIANLLIKIN